MDANTHIAIEVKNLHFGYDNENSWLIQDLNLSIYQGERFGLLGPNGAGKTTLMNLLTGVLKPLSGKITMFGSHFDLHPTEVKKILGVVPQTPSLYAELTAMENLRFFGAWSGVPKNELENRANQLLLKMGLDDAKNKSVSKFSGGMKSRLNLIVGVLHRPQILFLDEPTTSVDVHSRSAILHFLKELNQDGTTLVYTSHLLSEAEQLCTKIAFMDNGKIIAMGAVEELLLQSGHSNLESLFLSLTGRSYSNN
jgi:ABC-2 type transport system ATP-binding protein